MGFSHFSLFDADLRGHAPWPMICPHGVDQHVFIIRERISPRENWFFEIQPYYILLYE